MKNYWNLTNKEEGQLPPLPEVIIIEDMPERDDNK